MITILLGMQGFICLWDSRADSRHYIQNVWPIRDNMHPGNHNMMQEQLVDRSNILLPPLHIKFGLINNFIKALDKEGDTFQPLRNKFPHVSEAKINAGILNGPHIRELILDMNFDSCMNPNTVKAWISLKSIIKNFLGNHRSAEYEAIVNELMLIYKNLGLRMSIKMHFLDSHLDYFPANCGDYNEEQGERFHQDVSIMEERYQDRVDVNMLADYCWCLMRDEPNIKENLSKKKALSTLNFLYIYYFY